MCKEAQYSHMEGHAERLKYSASPQSFHLSQLKHGYESARPSAEPSNDSNPEAIQLQLHESPQLGTSRLSSISILNHKRK